MDDGDTIESDNVQDLDQKMHNFLGNHYPEVEVDDYESSGSKDYYNE